MWWNQRKRDYGKTYGGNSMRRLELTLTGRHFDHPELLLTYKLRYKDCGYGMFLLNTRTCYWYPTPEPLKSLNLKACYDNKSYLLCAMRAAIYRMKSKCPCTGGWCTSSRPDSQKSSPPQSTVLAIPLTCGTSRSSSTT